MCLMKPSIIKWRMGHEKERSTMEVDREVYFSEQLHVHLIHNLSSSCLKKITKAISYIILFQKSCAEPCHVCIINVLIVSFHLTFWKQEIRLSSFIVKKNTGRFIISLWMMAFFFNWTNSKALNLRYVHVIISSYNYQY